MFLGTSQYEKMKIVIKTVLVAKGEEHKRLLRKHPLEMQKSMMNCGMVSVYVLVICIHRGKFHITSEMNYLNCHIITFCL